MGVSKMNRGNFRNSEWTKTHTNTPIAVSSANQSVWLSTDGYDYVAVTSKSNINHSGRFQLIWSFDGVTIAQWELPVGVTGTFQNRQAITPVKAPYVSVYFENQDTTNAITVETWTYLKD